MNENEDAWVVAEQNLWDQMKDPGYGVKIRAAKRRLRSFEPGSKDHKDLKNLISKLEELQFTTGWKAFREFIEHNHRY